MKPKKNPKKDFTKHSNLYFAIGLCFMLFTSWRIAEIKTPQTIDGYMPHTPVMDTEVYIPVTKEQLKKPKPIKYDPIDFEIKKNEEKDDETKTVFFDPTDDGFIDDVVSIDPPIEHDIPFAIIEDVPLFPGCERVKKSESRKCFQEKIQRHIAKNFRYPEIAQEMGIQGRVYVQFIIDKGGTITSIRTRGPDKNLEKEANRIIGKLPTMTPGKQRGRPVRVPFSIPITFRLQ